jgi:hypothetical protein
MKDDVNGYQAAIMGVKMTPIFRAIEFSLISLVEWRT